MKEIYFKTEPAAIKQNPDAINHASDNLQNDPMLIKASEG